MANEVIITSRTFSLGEIDPIEARKKRYNTIVSILNSSKRVDLGGISVTSDIADDFSPESTYSAGDFVFHEGELYRAKEANGPGEFVSASWEKSNITKDALQCYFASGSLDSNPDLTRIKKLFIANIDGSVAVFWTDDGVENVLGGQLIPPEFFSEENAGKAVVINEAGTGLELAGPFASKEYVDGIVGEVETQLSEL